MPEVTQHVKKENCYFSKRKQGFFSNVKFQAAVGEKEASPWTLAGALRTVFQSSHSISKGIRAATTQEAMTCLKQEWKDTEVPSHTLCQSQSAQETGCDPHNRKGCGLEHLNTSFKSARTPPFTLHSWACQVRHAPNFGK